MRRLWLAFSALALLLTFAACGGDDDDDTADPNAENALAEELLLTVDDFPGGDWTETPDDEDDSPNPLDECDPGPAEGRTGEAETGDFTDGEATFQESIGVFESADDAVAALDRVPGMGDCMVAIVNDGGLDDDDATYSDATFEEVTAPDIGDDSIAYRLEMLVTATAEEGEEPDEGTLYFDLVFVTEGRFATYVSSIGVLEPLDASLVQAVVEAAHAKLAAAEQ